MSGSSGPTPTAWHSASRGPRAGSPEKRVRPDRCHHETGGASLTGQPRAAADTVLAFAPDTGRACPAAGPPQLSATRVSAGRSSSWAGNRVSRLAVPHCPKTCLRSEEDLESWYVKPADWYEAHDVELRTGSSVVASAADVYAAGDVANHLPRPARSRVTHRRAHGLAVAGAVTLSASHGRWLVSLTRRTAANS
jgi:hypothetical protein